MREAMLTAPLGDDVLGDDPTVLALQAKTAALVGMEDALFVPSGTMGNQVALVTHCRPGDAVLFEEEAHMVFYEAGAPGAFAGVVCRTVPSESGRMDPSEIRRRVMTRSYHTPGTTLLCVENTHNRGCGAALAPDLLWQYREIADETGMRMHLDGARVFNAAVALKVTVAELCTPFDTVSVCLSKGLGAPVGSVLCGPKDFIEEARYVRKRFGGGMRQSGLLAAVGIYCLDHMIDRLAEDHARARGVATVLQDIPGVTVDVSKVETNMVMVDTVAPAAQWCEALATEGIRALPFGPNRIRLVFHHQVTDAGAERCVRAFRSLAESGRIYS